MKHVSRFLKGIVLSALASAIVWGSAAAVPIPTYPISQDPASDAIVTGAPASQIVLASGSGTRILSRSGKITRSESLRGGSPEVLIGTTARSSRWKSRYFMSGLVLAALTPLALHRSGEPGDKSVAVETQTPASSSLPALGGRGGNGNGRGGHDDDGDDEEVCEDDGDHDGNGGDTGGHNDSDNGGDDGDDGGDNGGGVALPEPGTVPLIGAGLIMALALRSRRDH